MTNSIYRHLISELGLIMLNVALKNSQIRIDIYKEELTECKSSDKYFVEEELKALRYINLTIRYIQVTRQFF